MLPNDLLNLGDHIRVDNKAFTKPIHMKVKLDVLGFDHAKWGNLEHFNNLVVDRYYQEVTGASIFFLQFGGSIGIWEVKMCNTTSDEVKRSNA